MLRKSRRRRRRAKFMALACAGLAAAAGGIYFLGTHHLVAGSAIAGIAVVPKAGFSMAEVFVDHDGVRRLDRAEALAASPGYTALLAGLDSEQIEISRLNAQRAGPAADVVPGMTGAEVEELLGGAERIDRTSSDLEVRHHGSVLVLMERDRVLKVLR